MKQFKLDCYEISKDQKEEIQDSISELILEALDDYKLSKKGGIIDGQKKNVLKRDYNI